MQYESPRQREYINSMIEEAIVEAEKKGTQVLTLGLLNQVISVVSNFRTYALMLSPGIKFWSVNFY